MDNQVQKLTLKSALNIVVVSLMLLMENVDANVINIAVPSISNSLRIPPLDLKLAITSYLISLAIFVPISGYISDKFGTRKVLFFSIIGFTLCSLFCGISITLDQLVIFRFLQGVTGAFMLPVGRLLLLKIFGKKELVKVFVLISFVGALGPLIAPIIGGLIVTYVSWRFIFWVNLPIGVFCFLISYYYVDNYTEQVKRFNWWSFTFLGLFLSIVSYLLDTLFSPLGLKVRVLLLAIIAITLLLYLKFELNSKNRIIDYKLFALRTFRICFWSGLLLRIAFAGRAFLLALYYQLSLGLTPIESSYLLALHAVGLFIGRTIMRWLLPQFGFRQMLLVFNLLGTLTAFMLCLIVKVNFWAIMIILAHSMTSSIVFLLLNTLLFSDVPEYKYGGATSIANTMQQLTSSFGVTAIAAVLFLSNLVLTQFSYMVFVIAFSFIGVSGILLQLLLLKIRPDDGINLINRK
jgi:EmrB/QacA subfamily drug resistance transporter